MALAEKGRKEKKERDQGDGRMVMREPGGDVGEKMELMCLG